VSEDELAARLASEGLEADAWSNGPRDTYAAHSHGYDKVLVATSGSITFHLPGAGRDVTLNEGERLELPAGTMHGATVGPAGVRCLEAHLPANSLPSQPRHLVVGW
jgi:quercetin dioxygenase-like cupin family protein